MELETLPCTVCGSGDFKILLRKWDLPVSRCRRCGLVSANPRLPREEIWKRYNPDYFWKEYLPALGVHEGRFDLADFDARYRLQLELLSRALGGRVGTLLELGAGAGFFLKAAERAGWSVAGTEVSDAAIQFAREELGLHMSSQNAETLDFDSECFNAVVGFELIEHLLNPLAAMREARRVLRPGGVLMLSTPNYRSLSRLALGKAWHVIAPAEHLFYFTEETLRRLLHEAGFIGIMVDHRFAGFGVAGTMNWRATNAPDSVRPRAYREVVERLGTRLLPLVQSAGRGDTLFCVARRPDCGEVSS